MCRSLVSVEALGQLVPLIAAEWNDNKYLGLAEHSPCFADPSLQCLRHVARGESAEQCVVGAMHHNRVIRRWHERTRLRGKLVVPGCRKRWHVGQRIDRD